MNHRKLLILLAIFMLIGSSLACSLFTGSDEPAESAASENQPAEDAASQNAADEESVAADVTLGEVYRSEEGGYAFQPLPDYQMEEFFGLASMTAPDADPELGPMLMLIGGTNEEEATQDDIFNEFMQDAEGEDVQILEQKEITVDGKPGILAEISGDADGQPVVGRIVVVAVTPTQQFTMFASAPKDRWDEIATNFDVVLASIFFFEPKEIDLSEGLGELEELPGDSGDQIELLPTEELPTDELDIPSMSDFPTAYSDLEPGGFAYILASNDGSMPAIVNQGTLQDQSTAAEYVLGLVSADEQNVLTLFIPLDVAPGVHIMLPYDASAATKGPGAAVYKGLTLYINTDGIIMIEEMQGNTISGMAAFTAIDEDGNQLSVTGFFNQLPLP